MSLLSMERNAPCICGSGKKYKKCCLFTLEKLQRHWDRNKYEWLGSELAYVLALVCGLPQREGEIIPSLSEIEESLDYINENVYASDEEKGNDNFYDLIINFEDFLLEDQQGRELLLFPDEVVVEFLEGTTAKLDNMAKEPDQEEIAETFEDSLEEYLPRVVDEEMTERLMSALVFILRRRIYDIKERTALINALQLCLLERGANTIWEGIFRVSIAKLVSGAIAEEDRPDPAWPVLKAYIPEQECWNIGGIGSAGVVQEQPDGLYCLTWFYLSLSLKSIEFAWSKKDLTQEDLDAFIDEMWEMVPPWQESSLDMASRYIWGVYALGEEEGIIQEEIEPYLGIIPKPEGEQVQWGVRLLYGAELTSPKLAKIIAACGSPKELPEGKEFAVRTVITYRISEPRVIVKKFAELTEFAVEEKVHGQEWTISWLKEYPEGSEQQLKNEEKVRRVLATITINGGVLKAEAHTLNAAVMVAQVLRRYVGDQISYEGVAWTSYKEMFRKIQRGIKGRKRRRRNPRIK